MKTVRDMMFVSEEHDVAYGDVAQGFILENSRDGHIRTFDCLLEALQAMSDRTGTNVSQFGITDNPY